MGLRRTRLCFELLNRILLKLWLALRTLRVEDLGIVRFVGPDMGVGSVMFGAMKAVCFDGKGGSSRWEKG